jgi:hypothetical protein
MVGNALRSRWSWLDCWPGLTRLWLQGSWSGFCVAFVATILLQATLVHRLLWPEWFAPPVPHFLLLATVAFWVLGGLDGRRLRVRLVARAAEDPHLDLFLAARSEYLRGHWSEAEKLLTDLLDLSPDDAEARLLRATLLRHMGKPAEAREQLRRLQRWNRSAIWNLEIRREWEYLSRSVTDAVGRRPVARDAGADKTFEVSGSEAGSVIEAGQRDVA